MGRQEVAMVVEISGKGKHRGAAMYAEPLNSAAIEHIGHHTNLFSSCKCILQPLRGLGGESKSRI